MNTKRGQVALFVVLAIVIVAIVLVLLLYPGLRPFQQDTTFSPQSYLRSCIEPELAPAVQSLALQGGYANPQGFLTYQDEKIKYLCHTSEYYKTCTVQEPFIEERFEQELSDALQPRVQDCVQQLHAEYERRGYSVSPSRTAAHVSLEPRTLTVLIDAPLTITRESSQTFRDFSVSFNSELYDLLLTATSIVAYEAAYGDSETTLYLQYYPDLKIEKLKLSDGSKIYTLTNVVTNEQFRFASRSLSWPPGYTA